MLWRARQAFRHYQRASLIHTGRPPPPRPIVKLAPASAQWGSLAVARSPRPHTPQPQPQPQPQRSSSRPVRAIPPAADRPSQPPRNFYKTKYGFSLDTLHRRLEMGVFDRKMAADDHTSLLAILENPQETRDLAVLMTQHRSPQRCLYVLKLAHHLGCQLKTSIYESVAYALAAIRRWDLIKDVVVLAQQHTAHITVRLLNWRLRALMELSEFNEIDRAQGQFKAANLELNRLSYHLIISAHLRNRNLSKAKEFLVKMEEAGIPVDASTHAITATAYRTFGLDPSMRRQAVASLKDLDGRKGVAVLNSLIRMSIDRGDLGGASQYISFLDNPSLGLERRLVDGDVSTLQDDGSERRVRVPTRSRLSPDIATFTMIVEYMGRAGTPSRIPRVVKRMQAAKVQQDETFAEALVRAYVVGGDPGTAINIVFTLCRRHPEVYPHFQYLGVHDACKGGKGRPDLLELRLRPTERIFSVLLRSVLEYRGLVGMHAVTQIMAVFGLVPEATFVDTVLSYLVKHVESRPDKLVVAFEHLATIVPPTHTQILVVLGALVDLECTLIRQGSWHSTLAKFQPRMSKPAQISSLTPSSNLPVDTSYSDPIAGLTFERTDMASLLRPTVENFITRGVQSERRAFALRIRHDGIVKGDPFMAQETFQQMLNRGIYPDQHHFTALLEAFVSAGDMESAVQMMAHSKKEGFVPDIVMYTILLTGYAYLGQPANASRAFRAMLSQGIKPDGRAINVLASAYAAQGKYSKAKKVLIELWGFVGSFPRAVRDMPYKDVSRAFYEAVTKRSESPLSGQEQHFIRQRLRKLLWRQLIPSSYERVRRYRLRPIRPKPIKRIVKNRHPRAPRAVAGRNRRNRRTRHRRRY